jgi:GT2 family glycosyltransferase
VELSKLDSRIHLTRRSTNGGISQATNEALALAQGEFVAMLDHDDELDSDALLEVVRRLNDDPALDVVYTDQDFIDEHGAYSGHLLKPDWSPTLFLGVMYVGHLLVIRRSLAISIGGFDGQYDNVQDFEFMLRASEHTDRVAHIPRILYHWRRVPGSVALHGAEKRHIDRLQASAVTAHLARSGIHATARQHPRFAHRTRLDPGISATGPTIDAIVLATGRNRSAQALLGFFQRHSLVRSALLVRRGTASTGLTAATSAEISRSRADLILCLDADLVGSSATWLQELVLHAERPNVGLVAPAIVARDGTIEEAGLILGGRRGAVSALAGWPRDSDGYAGNLACAREVSAVSGSCVLIARRLFDELGGLNPAFASPRIAYIDLSMRASLRGLSNICVAPAQLSRSGRHVPPRHADSLDWALLRELWRNRLSSSDPYYNPQFRLD